MVRFGLLTLALPALALGGCSSDGSTVEGPVTVYVSLPLSGPAEADGTDAADGARLALEQAGDRAGGLEVRAELLDDAAAGKPWNPVAVGQNARRAAQDSSAAAYIGELDSQPTRASMPITNDAGIVQVSPGAGGIDLTAPAEGYPDSPERYRPSGEISFARVIPSDAEQVRAAAEWAGEMGLGRLLGAPDGLPFGNLMLSEFSADAAEVGVEVDRVQPGRIIGRSGPSFLAGAGPDGPGVLTAGGRRYVTSGALAPIRLPKSAFPADFRRRFERDPGPYAAYGYDAMQLVLEAIEVAEGKDEFRAAVVDAVLDADRPDSILGPYSIAPDGNTTLCAVQRYEERGELVPLEAPCPRG